MCSLAPRVLIGQQRHMSLSRCCCNQAAVQTVKPAMYLAEDHHVCDILPDFVLLAVDVCTQGCPCAWGRKTSIQPG